MSLKLFVRDVQNTIYDGEVNGIPLTHLEYELKNLPEAHNGTVYVVSPICLQAAHALGRYDVVCVSDEIRSADRNTVIGAKALSQELLKERPEFGPLSQRDLQIKSKLNPALITVYNKTGEAFTFVR